MAAFRGWTVVEEIPSGGQGDVFKVRRPRDASEYALKRLKNPDRMERFEREIEVTKRLHEQLGSSFPEIVETGADRKGRPYYVMSWLEGSLQREVDRGLYREQIPDGLARLIELADVLAALHATELAHRDLKPANVLADACGRLVLADFGLAIEAAELADPFRLTASDEAIGSRYYIAPENEDGASAEVDQRPCDCYAFGKMIWVLLVGKRPLSRETQLEPPNRLVDRLGDDRLAALDGLCSQLLARDPRARLGDWPLIRTELVRLRASLSEGPIQTAAPDDADLAAAITSARAFRSSPEAQQIARRQATDQRRAEDYQALIRAVQSVANQRGQEISEIGQETGGHFNIDVGSESHPALRAVLDGLRKARYRHEILDVTIQPHSLQRGCAVTVRLDCLSEPDIPSLHISGWVVQSAERIWTLRAPISVNELTTGLAPDLVERFVEVEGPFALGLEAATDAAEQMARRICSLGVALASTYIENVREARNVLSPDSWPD